MREAIFCTSNILKLVFSSCIIPWLGFHPSPSSSVFLEFQSTYCFEIKLKIVFSRKRAGLVKSADSSIISGPGYGLKLIL